MKSALWLVQPSDTVILFFKHLPGISENVARSLESLNQNGVNKGAVLLFRVGT